MFGMLQRPLPLARMLPIVCVLQPNRVPKNYVASLSLPAAMDFGSVSDVTLNGTALLAGTDYSVTNTDNTYTFTFSQSFLNTISEESQIILNFSASLNANAVVGGRTGGNISSAWLSYGSSSAAIESDPINVATYTYQVSVVKTNPDNLVLNGAQFSLFEGDTLIYFVDEGNGQYRVADAQDSNTISTFFSWRHYIKRSRKWQLFFK